MLMAKFNFSHYFRERSRSGESLGTGWAEGLYSGEFRAKLKFLSDIVM